MGRFFLEQVRRLRFLPDEVRKPRPAPRSCCTRPPSVAVALPIRVYALKEGSLSYAPVYEVPGQ
jgi:hypothetical protein